MVGYGDCTSKNTCMHAMEWRRQSGNVLTCVKQVEELIRACIEMRVLHRGIATSLCEKPKKEDECQTPVDKCWHYEPLIASIRSKSGTYQRWCRPRRQPCQTRENLTVQLFRGAKEMETEPIYVDQDSGANPERSVEQLAGRQARHTSVLLNTTHRKTPRYVSDWSRYFGSYIIIAARQTINTK